jgi:hypothetical protein
MRLFHSQDTMNKVARNDAVDVRINATNCLSLRAVNLSKRQAPVV